MFLFIVLSTLLLGSYNIFMARSSSSKNIIPVKNITSFDEINSQSSPKYSVSSSSSTKVTNISSDKITLHNNTFELTWNKTNGALLQVVWSDGTSFFPDCNENCEPVNCFSGLGVSCDVDFFGEPQISSNDTCRTVVFKSHSGDNLTYTIPHQGHVIGMEWNSLNKFSINLIPKPVNLAAVKGLGRVFTIQNDSIKATSWTSIIKDSFFSFLGIKRKELPPVTRWLGIDAGIDKGKPNQTTHYFAAIWDTSREPQCNIYKTPGYVVTPDNSGKVSARLYLGPKQAEELTFFSVSDNPKDREMFKQVVDFGFFGLVAKVLFIVLHAIHSVVPNWGWAIILLTILIRGILWPLNTKTTVQMLRMKELEPYQKTLQAKYEKFGNDINKKAEMQKELMAFYKKNNHNPMGGCLPTLLQMPVFFALWSMLSAVFELRNAPFLGWLIDLSSRDPYYILPILMGASMIIQQLITPAVGDPSQRKIMMILMPIMFSFFFANTPSGLCLYYLIFNIIGILQTWLVIKNYKSQPVNI
jgi:YidC/Oxa1 family membrane protein insertase